MPLCRPPDEYDGDDSALRFWVKAPTLPRVGESLDFDAVPGLMLTVTGIDHAYSTAEYNEHPHFTIVVDASVDPISVSDAQELFLDEAKWERWLTQFPLLEAFTVRPREACSWCHADGT